MAEIEETFSQLPQPIKSLLYRIDIRSRYIQSVVREESDNTYTVTLKQKHRLSDGEFELTSDNLRYLYREDAFVSIANPDRREGLLLKFRI